MVGDASCERNNNELEIMTAGVAAEGSCIDEWKLWLRGQDGRKVTAEGNLTRREVWWSSCSEAGLLPN